jgi:hypothetical protein
VNNKEWVIGSAAGVVSAVVAIITLFRKCGGSRQSQTSGANSTNVQAGRDINLSERSSTPDDGR